jgi:hypothetical protein
MTAVIPASVVQEILTAIPEGSSRVLEAPLLQADGVTPITDIGSITSLTLLSLVDVTTGSVVNGRTNVNALPYLGIDAWVRFPLTPADTAAIGDARYQQRRATWRVQFTDGQEHAELLFWVENLAGVS